MQNGKKRRNNNKSAMHQTQVAAQVSMWFHLVDIVCIKHHQAAIMVDLHLGRQNVIR